MREPYVRRLFDHYAERCGAALTEQLACRGPAILLEAVENVMRAAGRPLRFGAPLDLGCGTGLGGAAFRPFVDRLVGVDLSQATVAQAAAKGLYDRLVTADLNDFLAAEARDAAQYDLVLAADVFVYINDMVPIIAAVARIFARGGLIAFTVETHCGDGAELLPTLRCAHGEAHIRRAPQASSLAVAHLAGIAVRRERRVPVDSLVAVAQASTPPQAPATSAE